MTPRKAGYVVLDFETTGLSPRRDEVIETGAVHFDGAVGGRTFHALSRPRRAIPEGASRVHGITDACVAGQPAFRERVGELLEFLEDRVVVAHHARFDGAFLRFAAGNAGFGPLRLRWLCTVRLSRRLFPELAHHDLESLCRHHGIPRAARHRALEDAVATAWLLDVLLERAEERGVSSVPELLALGAPPGAGARPPAPRPLDEEERARLEEAILTGDTVALHYVSRRGVRSRRNVVPYAAHPAQAPVTLVAYDLATGATRTYRLDRIVRIGDATEAAEETDVEPARSP